MKTMRGRRVLAALGVGIGVSAWALAAAKPFAGAWKIEGDVAGTPVSQTCTFKRADTTLSGACVGEGDRTLELSGELHDKAVTWKVATEWNGTAITVTFSGTLESDVKMTGKIDVQPFGVEGTFTGARSE